MNDQNPQIRTLAHLELARAPYKDIRRHGDSLSRAEIYEFLQKPRYLEWHSLYILLLAQSDVPGDKQHISESMKSSAQFGRTTNLAAWTVAYLELEEERAMDFLDEHYLKNGARRPEEIREILRALSVHGTSGHVHLKDRIISSYEALLTRHPGMAPSIVADLLAWNRPDLKNKIAAILKTRPPLFDLTTTLKLRKYVRMPSVSPAK